TKRRRLEEEASIPKLAYHSLQGWTGALEVKTNVGSNNDLVVGVQSDGDSLVERQAGINMRLSHAIGERVRMRFNYESLHEQWNQSTLNALAQRNDMTGIYRTRMSFQPNVSVAIAPGLTWTAGVTFENLQMQFPAARTESANA